MAARPRKNNISIPNLYPLFSRKVNKVYWRYKHPITGKFHSLGTDEAEATAIAIEANKRLAEQQTRQILLVRPSRQRSLVILMIYEITPHHLLHAHRYH